jgi:hypothetical protein
MHTITAFHNFLCLLKNKNTVCIFLSKTSSDISLNFNVSYIKFHFF